MWNKLMRFGLGAFFASCGAWLFAFGLGLLDLYVPSLSVCRDWAWSVFGIFYRLAPIVDIGMWVGVALGTMSGEAPWHLAGAVLYFVAAIVLLIGWKKHRELVAVVCWISATMLLVRIFSFAIAGGLTFHKALYAYGINFTLLLGYAYLGYRVHTGAFARSDLV